MPPKRVHYPLNYYHQVLHRSTDKFACPLCKISILPKMYERHCLQKHDTDGKTCCVWCRNQSWVASEKFRHANHLIDCFRRFIQSLKKDHPVKETSYRLLSMRHGCEEKYLYGHVLAESSHLVWPLNVSFSEPAITFSDTNLNLAASYVRKYLETKSTHDWIHVMIKVGAFESFVRALDRDEGSTRTLEFSCWCDGGPYEKAADRQHRHVMVVSHPKGHFEKNVWPEIKLPKGYEKPVSNFPCKRSKEIVSPLHLVNAMGYVSHRKSRCDFSFQKSKKNPKPNHFYIYKTLPKTYKLHLVQLWDGGVYQLLYQEKFQNASIPRMTQFPMIKKDGRWVQKMKHFYDHERGLILNVSSHFVPVETIATPFFFCLMGGRKLYFQSLSKEVNQDKEDWIRKQAMGGNCFYDVVEENEWIPRKRDQKTLNFHKPVLDRKNELEVERDEWKRNIQKCETKIKKLENELGSKDLKITKLQDCIDNHNQEENARLKRENKFLKMKLVELSNMKN